MVFKKKAISPIIATILLVVISLILVGILLSWGQNFIQRSTSDADTAIERKCIGADITLNYCDYNAPTDKLELIIVNSGKIDFKEDTTLSLILIDADKTLNNEETDILDSGAFVVGASRKITVEDYVATTPIDLEIKSSQCVNFFKRTTCN